MALPEALWRNSLWSRDNYDIGLHSPEELSTRSNRASGNEVPAPAPPDPVSKWSSESENDDDWNENRGSRLFQLIGRSAKNNDAQEPKHDELSSHMPRAYAGSGSQRPRRNSSPDVRRNGMEEGEQQDRRHDAVSLEEVPAQEPPKMSLWRESLFVTTICVAHLCAREFRQSLTTSVLVPNYCEINSMTEAGIGQTLPIMKSAASRFRVANADDLSSSISGYAIVLSTFILVARRLGKVYGHKPIFMLGLVWSAIWSLIVGASFYSNRSLFIASRAFQGLGAALTLPTGLSLLSAMRPTGVRKIVIMNLYAAMSPLGLIIGALGASILDMMAWWPWVYWAFSITLVVLRTISRFVIPSTPLARRPPSGARGLSLELDIPGMVTGITSLGLFGFAWGQAQVDGWQQGYVYIILIMSLVLAVAFVVIEAWYTRNPLIPYAALSLEVSLILVAIGSGWSCFGIWMFYGWQFVERFRSASSLLVSCMP
ncbi:major facilitator superfamily-domain-containing protein [Xylaria curta]|nr:major facilitator superfamily-domain-containing protein [Xylaria curta]